MKKLFRWTANIATIIILVVSASFTRASAQNVSVSFQTFYDELSPYGQWIDDPNYGYVWAPDAGDDFRPYYSDGRWAMTDYGNTWVSDYNWGWAPFHYGRWTYDNYYGWVWVPGATWGPAWVNWRSGGGYYGWAPLGPGISISIGSYNAPYDWWTFIPCQNIYSNSYSSYWRGPRYNSSIYQQTTIINNYYNNQYVSGPRRNDIEQYTGGKVNVYNIRNDRGPRKSNIRNNDLAMYRPQVTQGTRNGGQRTAPRNVVSGDHSIGRANGLDNNNGIRNPKTDRSVSQPTRSDRSGQMDNSQLQRDNIQRQQAVQQNTQRANAQRQQVEQQRVQRENVQRQQVENQLAERGNNQSQQAEQQRAQRENVQRQQAYQQQQEQRVNVQRQQVEQQRVQRENVQRQQASQQQEQRENAQRQQAEQQRVQRENVQRQQPQQREWRRPEPQRVERPQQNYQRPQRQNSDVQHSQPERSNVGRERRGR